MFYSVTSINSELPQTCLDSHSALIVEGGALRSVFSAGLLDGFLKNQFNPFDIYFGVSAGANNLATYLAGETEKSLKIYAHLVLQREFLSYKRFVNGGHLIDLDWLAEETSGNAYINVPAAFRHNKPFYVVLTDVFSGEARYVKATPENLLTVIKASAALPLLYRGFPNVDQQPMTDGGIADGIPVLKAINAGARRIMVIRSRERSYRKKDTLYHRYIRWKLKSHYRLVDAMRKRVRLFNETIKLINNPPYGVKVLEVCPPPTIKLGRFTRNYKQLMSGYLTGLNMAEKVIQDWHVL